MKNKIYFIIFIAVLMTAGILIGGSCHSNQKRTTLDLCLQSGISDGFFSGKTGIKDSAYIDKCARFHREQLVNKYLYEEKRDPETGKLISRKQIKNHEGEKPYKISEILYYIENGSFPR